MDVVKRGGADAATSLAPPAYLGRYTAFAGTINLYIDMGLRKIEERLLPKGNSIVASSLDFALKDSNWKKFGFKGRPTYGEVFNKFRKDWKVELEDKLFLEFVILYASTSLLIDISDKRDRSELSKYVTEKITGVGSDIDMWKTFGFQKEIDCVNHIYFGIQEYFENELNDWHKIFSANINFDKIPDEKVKAKILLGLFHLNESHNRIQQKIM